MWSRPCHLGLCKCHTMTNTQWHISLDRSLVGARCITVQSIAGSRGMCCVFMYINYCQIAFQTDVSIHTPPQSHLSVSFETSSFKIFSSPNFRAVQMCWETVVWQKQPGTERSFSLCGSGALPIPWSRIHMNMLPLPWTPVSLCLNCRHGAKLSLKFLPTLTFCSLDMKK